MMHMYEIYEEFLDNFPVNEKEMNFSQFGREISDAEVQKFLNSLHFGREGKLYFPVLESTESQTIENQLGKIGLIQTNNIATRANLQISTYGLGGFISPHYDTYTRPGEGKIQVGEALKNMEISSLFQIFELLYTDCSR